MASKYQLASTCVPLRRRPERQRVGRATAVVTMTVQSRRRDQCLQTIDQLQRREGKRHGAIALGSGQALDDVLLIDQTEPFKRE